MTIVQIDSLAHSFGAQQLFAPFSAQIAHGDRIALIGDNGTGKSTLLAVLAGELRPSLGEVRAGSGIRVGYLHQTARLHGAQTLIEAMDAPFAEIHAIESTMRRLEHDLAAGGGPEAEARYDHLLHEFRDRGGYEVDARIRAVLAGVGFPQSAFSRPIEQLSGGESARAALARALLEAPDLLMLDEPTNHLDFAALDWLEDSLLGFDGAVVLVSHDRHLLEKVGNRTWEIAFGEVTQYRVGYEESRILRSEFRRQHERSFRDQQDEIEKMKDFVRRHHAGQKHRQAKDRERKLERIEAERIERPRTAKRMALSIPIGEPSGRTVLETTELQVGYDKPLFTAPPLRLERHDRVAIVGPNGCGKTTLLKSIMGSVPLLVGRIRHGHNVHPAVFSQTQEGLHTAGNVLDAVLDWTSMTIGDARAYLGKFLFSGDDVYKSLASLSGGERSRLALAQLSLIEGNLLLLDEPTNHLDLASQELLQEALAHYAGTVVLVSHDRTLLEAIATRLWVVEGAHLVDYAYGYRTYCERRRTSAASEGATRQGSPQSGSNLHRADPSPPQQRNAAGSGPQKRDRYQLRRYEQQIRELETRIEGLEDDMKRLEQEITAATNAGDGRAIADLGRAHAETADRLAGEYRIWEDLIGEINPNQDQDREHRLGPDPGRSPARRIEHENKG
ncbi:ABC-F family ATP-binding cassette domain-containing protein [Candidatus Bipolaricaulota bacterium]|nr:ABC-F family ATP-binding cassette domain-containing protein [Candidatus Bipolaricaulota bacterium]